MSQSSWTQPCTSQPIADRSDNRSVRYRQSVRGLLLLCALTMSILASAAITTAAPASASPAGPHLQFAHSGKCATDPRLSTTIGQRLDQFSCVSPSQTNQQWILHPIPGHASTYLVQNAYSAQCMGIEGRSTAAGAAVIQTPCTYADSSLWFKQIPSGRTTPYYYFLLQNAHSLMCVNVYGASTANGASLIQWPCSKTANNEQMRAWLY
jgi:hypothetical protein